jgi:2-oxo-4-hydroxy-4-carboxy--5-ureidoimidazoline (OHCU) decarboxylase
MINYIFLENKLAIKSDLIKKIQLLSNKRQKLSDEDYEYFHEICMDYMQRFGFDENYLLTPEGKMVEQIMDEIFDLQEKNGF